MATNEDAGPGGGAAEPERIDHADFEGYLDAVEGGRVYGWAISPAEKSRRLSITLMRGSEELAVVVADRFREDLVDYGDGSGRHAFVFTLPRHLWDCPADEFHACFTGTDIPLLRGSRATAMTVREQPGTALETTSEQPKETDRRALSGRIEALERSVVGVIRLEHARSDTVRQISLDVARLQNELAALRKDLRSIEPFLVRLDERMKAGEARATDRGRKREGRRGTIAIVLLLAVATALGYVTATLMMTS